VEHALTVRMFLFGMTPAQFRIIAPSKDGKSGTGIRGWSDSRWLAAGGAGGVLAQGLLEAGHQNDFVRGFVLG
jgi:hypothetical protein